MFSIKLTISGALLVAAVLTPICALAGNGGRPPAMPEEAVQNQQGMAHFHYGYYKLIPHGRKSEAGRQMDLAEQAFLDAIEINPGYVEAYRNLARLYYLRGKFEGVGDYTCGQIVSGYDPSTLASFTSTLQGDTLNLVSFPR